VAVTQVYQVLCILLLFFWGVYSLFYRSLFSKILTWIHIVVTVLFFIFLAIEPYTQSPELPRQYSDAHYFFNRFITVFSIVWMIMQLLFLFNILAGVLKRIAKR
jgi:uncharacterized membrane protein